MWHQLTSGSATSSKAVSVDRRRFMARCRTARPPRVASGRSIRFLVDVRGGIASGPPASRPGPAAARPPSTEIAPAGEASGVPQSVVTHSSVAGRSSSFRSVWGRRWKGIALGWPERLSSLRRSLVRWTTSSPSTSCSGFIRSFVYGLRASSWEGLGRRRSRPVTGKASSTNAASVLPRSLVTSAAADPAQLPSLCAPGRARPIYLREQNADGEARRLLRRRIIGCRFRRHEQHDQRSLQPITRTMRFRAKRGRPSTSTTSAYPKWEARTAANGCRGCRGRSELRLPCVVAKRCHEARPPSAAAPRDRGRRFESATPVAKIIVLAHDREALVCFRSARPKDAVPDEVVQRDVGDPRQSVGSAGTACAALLHCALSEHMYVPLESDDASVWLVASPARVAGPARRTTS